MKQTISIIILTIYLSFCNLYAQNENDSIIFKAMNDELNRNIKHLTLENSLPPFFISYQLSDNHSLFIKASYGSILQSLENRNRRNFIRLMMGNYVFNDENFVGGQHSNNSSSDSPIPIENDYNAIRQAFWSGTDQVYKSAIETYEQKKTALKLQNKTEDRLDDYTKIDASIYIRKQIDYKYDKPYWENVAKQVSSVFLKYPKITTSNVYIQFIRSQFYMTSSEGSKVTIPINLAMVMVNAVCRADDGEQLYDISRIFVPIPDSLPSTDQLITKATSIADNLMLRMQSIAIEESYTGPVIFEGESLADVISACMFENRKLIAHREPDFANENDHSGFNSDLKIDKKICNENISIVSTPKLKQFNNKELVGTFEIDCEGIIPSDELILIENGRLKNLLNDRIPTEIEKKSNGYYRISLHSEGLSNPLKAPGVIFMKYKDTDSYKSLLKKTAKAAKKQELDYFFIIRKVSGSNPLEIIKVSAKTGEQQLVRKALIGEIDFSIFNSIIGATDDIETCNTILSFNQSFVPVSYIIPKAISFNSIKIEKDKGSKMKLPIVKNPLEE